MNTIKATNSVKLVDWESSHFAWSTSISINDCVKYSKTNSSYLERQAFLVMRNWVVRCD